MKGHTLRNTKVCSRGPVGQKGILRIVHQSCMNKRVEGHYI